MQGRTAVYDSGSIKHSSLPLERAIRDPVRVLFLSDHLAYPSGVVHGASRYFLEVLPRIDRTLVRLTVCFLRERHPLAQQLERRQVRPLFFDRPKWDPRAVLDLIRVIRRQRIEVVHAAGFKGMLLGRIAARVTGARAIIHLHDMDRQQPWVRRLLLPGGRWADLALGVSRPVCRLAVEEFGVPEERVRLLYNALDIERFRAVDADTRWRVRRELALPHDAPVVGVIARFYPDKGHALMMRSWRRVLRALPQARLLLVGDGPERARCEALSAELDMESAVCFIGQRDDVPDLLAAMDVVAMPSRREGLPFAALEALAAGRPLVGFDVGGLPEVILNGKTGRLVPPADEVALAEAIIDLLGRPAELERLRNGCWRHVEQFGLDAHVQQLQQMYRSLARRVSDEPAVPLELEQSW